MDSDQPQTNLKIDQRKYKLVEKVRDSTPEDEIRVTFAGDVAAYVQYALKVFDEGKPAVTLCGTGRAMPNVVETAEELRRQNQGIEIHQVVTAGHQEVIDEWQPTEPGLKPIIQKRKVCNLRILLTKDPSLVDKDKPGYQKPLEEKDFAEYRSAWESSGGRGGKRGGRGRGRYSGHRAGGARGGRGDGGAGKWPTNEVNGVDNEDKNDGSDHRAERKGQGRNNSKNTGRDDDNRNDHNEFRDEKHEHRTENDENRPHRGGGDRPRGRGRRHGKW